MKTIRVQKFLVGTVAVLATSAFLAAPVRVMAQDTEIICPEPYGGGVVCGVHTPVATGIADNLALIGGAMLVASGILLFIDKKHKLRDLKHSAL